MAPGGYSTLERHEHVHAVMILRGRGHCLVGARCARSKPHDLVTMPPWTWHQFRATAGEPLGFLCMVNAVRDKPQLPSEEELAAMKANPSAGVETRLQRDHLPAQHVSSEPPLGAPEPPGRP